jgi:hypothetical protein
MLIDLLEKNWHLVIAGYYILFLGLTAFRFPDEKKGIFQDGKLRLRQFGHWLAFAWTIPTLFVLIGLVGSLILAGLGTSGDCHPAHGWMCETPPDFTFAYYLSFFKGGVAWIQVMILVIASVGGTLFVIGFILWLIYKKCFPLISRAGKVVWKRLPVRW